MSFKQEKPTPILLAPKSSTSFSTISSAASATSIGTSRSGGSKLLFGEIDTSSDRSSETFASVCSLVLSDSSTFLRFWLTDTCRENLLSYLLKPDLAQLRLVCHDFSVRAAPALFEDLSITFKSSTFTRPARLAALDRIGFYVKTLSFNLPHTPDTFLPPLVHPETGEELSFTYTPQVHLRNARQPKYGDEGTTDVLTKQYPPLFHAATNVSAFIHGFTAFVNLSHLKVSCPGYDTTQRYRRSVVDFALISLRIAIERNCLNALEALTLAPMHPDGLLYLSPRLGYGATPNSARRWSRIKHLTIHATASPHSRPKDGHPDHCRLLQTYLTNFQTNLHTLDFRWLGERRPLPIYQQQLLASHIGQHPANSHTNSTASSSQQSSRFGKPLHFPRIRTIHFDNISVKASEISILLQSHKPTLSELDLQDVELTHGTWEDAFAPLHPPPPLAPVMSAAPAEVADIPIMFSPSTGGSQHHPAHARRMERVEGRRRAERRKTPGTARKVKAGCEELLGKVFRGSIGLWR